MVVRKRIFSAVILLFLVWVAFKGPVEESIIHEKDVEEAARRREERQEAQQSRGVNIIEEMLKVGNTLWEEAEPVQVGGCEALLLTYPFPEYPYLQIGMIYSSQYRKLYFYGEVIGQEPEQGKSYQELFNACLEEEEISWKQVEAYKEDFLYDQLFDPWFARGEGQHTRDELGNLEVIDFLMPYTYCGLEISPRAEVEVAYEEGYEGMFPQKITTITRTNNTGSRSVQRIWEYRYSTALERIEEDIQGLETWHMKFHALDENGEPIEMSIGNILKEVYEYDWEIPLYEGKFIGSLTKLAYCREEGEEVTRQWLAAPNYEYYHYEVRRSKNVYFDEDYLYVQVPAYDWNSEGLEWILNGVGNKWETWLAFAWEDLYQPEKDNE